MTSPSSTSVLYAKSGQEKQELEEEELDIYDQIAQNLQSFKRPSSQDEWEDYCSQEPYEITGTALEWWCQKAQRKRWPKLSYMAIDILSIPAISNEAEQVFSEAHYTMTWERMSIGFENLERVEYIKHWKKSGILDYL